MNEQTSTKAKAVFLSEEMLSGILSKPSKITAKEKKINKLLLKDKIIKDNIVFLTQTKNFLLAMSHEDRDIESAELDDTFTNLLKTSLKEMNNNFTEMIYEL